MKQLTLRMLSVILISLMQSSSFSQTAKDEKDIYAVFNKMNEAWAAHDYGYTHDDILDDNAFLVNPIGMYWKGKDEIPKALKYLGEVRFKYERPLQDSILSIRFLSPSSALVVSKVVAEIIQDFIMPGETNMTKKGERFESFQTYTLVKQNVIWKITSITATQVATGLR